MTTSLQSLDHIQSMLLIKWTIYNYREEPGDFPNTQIIRFNDSIRDKDFTEGGGVVTYSGLGPLVSFGNTKNSIRSSGSGTALGLSGVPDTQIKTLLASDIKGSRIEIFRFLQYPGTDTAIADLDFTGGATGGVIGRFLGYVNTYTINDDVNHTSDTRLVEVVLDCVNNTHIISKQVRGIRTNPKDVRFLNINEAGFDNVPSLYDSEWYFGGSK
tara:strand:- start:10999 stop:11640 length:642 start_codon:yes stop_codon:yes gene_type:complete